MILIVEDDPHFGVELLEALQRLGIEAQTSGPALPQPEQISGIDTILLDLAMPDNDGLDWLRHISNFASKPAIIMMSGFGEDVLSTACSAAEELGFEIKGALTKPFDAAQVKRLLRADTHLSIHGKVLPEDFEALRLAIHDDIVSGTLNVAFQPKVSVEGRAFAGAEALLGGWISSIGPKSPEIIVEAVNADPQLMRDMTWEIFEQSAQACSMWKSARFSGAVSVNVPACVISQPDFIRKLEDLRARYALDARDITIEMTENNIYHASEPILTNLARLRMLGYGLALDDVGQRNSGLVQLALLPVTELKVDMRLLADARTWRKARSILASMSSMARSMDIKITVEGVEQKKDMLLLSLIGADYAQGFLFSRKVPIGELIHIAPLLSNKMNAESH